MAHAEALVARDIGFPDNADALNARYGNLPAEDVLRLAFEQLFPGRIALVSSFGAESAVLLHMVAEIDRATPVLFLDTGRHFAETLGYRDTLAQRLGLTDLRSIRPDPARSAAADPALRLFDQDPDLCCHIRKTEPLAEALGGFDAWISGRKRFQTASRAGLMTFEAEPQSGRIKVNPLAHWSGRDLAAYMDRHELPRHPLQSAGYLSIGCASCTSPVGALEDPRAGRWSGRDKAECGIHIVDGKIVRQAEASMDVFRKGRFETDAWRRVADDAPLPDSEPALISLSRWRAERDRLMVRNGPLGLVVAPDDSLEDRDWSAELRRFPVIAIDFPAFTDGRGYSHARILRERFGYAGELRAVGEVLIDQIPFMMRVGIDAFTVTDAPTRRRLEDGRIPGITRHYQPVSDKAERPAGWSWRRHHAGG